LGLHRLGHEVIFIMKRKMRLIPSSCLSFWLRWARFGGCIGVCLRYAEIQTLQLHRGKKEPQLWTSFSQLFIPFVPSLVLA
jgi:hypothetical protein